MTRNRVKRLFREAARPILAEQGDSYDLVLVARSGADGASFSQISRSVCRAIRAAEKKAGISRGEG